MGVRTQEIDVTTFMDYTQIADDLIARIHSGEYPPGAQLPSYAELGKIYTVSVSTSSRVYNRLRMLGYAVTSSGRGVYVVDPLPPR